MFSNNNHGGYHMPHYVTQLDDAEGHNGFAIYSTIVDGLLTPELTAKEMRAWLDDNQPRYATWLTPYDAEQVVRDWSDGSEALAKMYRHNAKYYYWHAKAEFCYVQLSDEFFVLPREHWRNGE